jgi:CRP-like cAMP-binding protein
MDPARLASIPLFAKLSDDERARVAAAMEPVSVDAGELLCLQSEFAYRFFVIEEGTAEVLTDGIRVAELSAGDCFGEIGLLVTGRRVASVTAKTRCGSLSSSSSRSERFHAISPS